MKKQLGLSGDIETGDSDMNVDRNKRIKTDMGTMAETMQCLQTLFYLESTLMDNGRNSQIQVGRHTQALRMGFKQSTETHNIINFLGLV